MKAEFKIFYFYQMRGRDHSQRELDDLENLYPIKKIKATRFKGLTN